MLPNLNTNQANEVCQLINVASFPRILKEIKIPVYLYDYIKNQSSSYDNFSLEIENTISEFLETYSINFLEQCLHDYKIERAEIAKDNGGFIWSHFIFNIELPIKLYDYILDLNQETYDKSGIQGVLELIPAYINSILAFYAR